MKRPYDARVLLRWYPEGWRTRYGEEFIALLEDKIGDETPSLTLRWSVATSGVRERCHESGLLGQHCSVAQQRRNGAFVVLVAWAVMSVGGMGLFKSAEHFSNSLPVGSRTVTELAYNVVALGGVVGTMLVVAAAGVALPALIRFLRGGGSKHVRKAFARAGVFFVLLSIVTVGCSTWAHQLDSAQRNGGNLM